MGTVLQGRGHRVPWDARGIRGEPTGNSLSGFGGLPTPPRGHDFKHQIHVMTDMIVELCYF